MLSLIVSKNVLVMCFFFFFCVVSREWRHLKSLVVRAPCCCSLCGISGFVLPWKKSCMALSVCVSPDRKFLTSCPWVIYSFLCVCVREQRKHRFLLYLTNHHPFHASRQPRRLLAPPPGPRAPSPFARRSPAPGTLDMPGAVASGYDQDYYYTQC